METTRRAFCIAGPLALAASIAVEPRLTYGRVTVAGWIAHKHRTGRELHIWVDGEDVTRRCKVANDRRGYAILYEEDARGRFYIGLDGRAARRIHRGPVVITEREAT